MSEASPVEALLGKIDHISQQTTDFDLWVPVRLTLRGAEVPSDVAKARARPPSGQGLHASLHPRSERPARITASGKSQTETLPGVHEHGRYALDLVAAPGGMIEGPAINRKLRRRRSKRALQGASQRKTHRR
jgi:hypothetical protein